MYRAGDRKGRPYGEKPAPRLVGATLVVAQRYNVHFPYSPGQIR